MRCHRFAQALVLLAFLLLNARVQAGQTEATGVPVEVVSGSQYNSSFGLVGRDEGTDYIVRGADALYLLSCNRQWSWEHKCPVLAAGEKFSLSIDAKNHVHLAGTKGGKPVDIKLEYEKSEQLPSSTRAAVSQVAPATPASEPADVEAAPISDSGNAFLAACNTGRDKIMQAACNLWADGFLNGLAAGIAAASPEDVNPEKTIICFPKTATHGQLLPLILKYIKDHPADEDQPTASLAFQALQEKFPCKN
jgi:hypothetical protein